MGDLASSKILLAAIAATRSILKESSLEACDKLGSLANSAKRAGNVDELDEIHAAHARVVERCLINDFTMSDFFDHQTLKVDFLCSIEERRLQKGRRKNRNRRRRGTQGATFEKRTNRLPETEEEVMRFDLPASLDAESAAFVVTVLRGLSRARARRNCLLEEQRQLQRELEGARRHEGVTGVGCVTVLFTLLPGADGQNTTDIVDEIRDSIANYYGVLLLVAGFVMIYFGAKLAKPTLGACGFIVAATSGFMLAVESLQISVYVAAAIAGVLGLACALISVKVWKFSLFVVGVATGVSFWSLVRIPLGSVSDEILYSVCAGMALVCGLVAVQFEKGWIRFSSPLVGTVAVLQGLGNLFGLPFDLVHILTNGYSCANRLCPLIYTLIFLFPASGYLYQEWARKRLKRAKNRGQAAEPGPPPEPPPVYLEG